jgi:Peptidase family M48
VRSHPHLKRALRKLRAVKDQIGELLGLPEDALSVELCEGSNASITRDGRIGVGVQLLERHAGDDDLLVAILGHEIGHQPWTWPEGNLGPLNQRQLQELYREEEAKADRFAGRVLAELGADPSRICEFLQAAERFEQTRPRDYYPADVRARIIRDAFRRRARSLEEAKRVNPLLGLKRRELR